MAKPDRERTVPTRALYVGIAFCALLAVVALATRGERPPAAADGGARTLPGEVFDYVFTFSLLLGLGLVVGVAYVRASAGPDARRTWGVRQMLVFVVTIAAVCVAAVVVAEAIRDNPNEGLGRLLGRTSSTVATDEEGRPVRPRPPEFEWQAVIVAALLVGAGYGAYRLTRRRPRAERTLRGDLTAILEDTLDKLRDEQDPRRAVILAYAWMERTLAAHGLARVPSEAPLEYLARVLLELEASRASVFELTALFERARFSTHDVDEEMKREAIAALGAVRDELLAAEDPAEAPAA